MPVRNTWNGRAAGERRRPGRIFGMNYLLAVKRVLAMIGSDRRKGALAAPPHCAERHGSQPDAEQEHRGRLRHHRPGPGSGSQDRAQTWNSAGAQHRCQVGIPERGRVPMVIVILPTVDMHQPVVDLPGGVGPDADIDRLAMNGGVGRHEPDRTREPERGWGDYREAHAVGQRREDGAPPTEGARGGAARDAPALDGPYAIGVA